MRMRFLFALTHKTREIPQRAELIVLMWLHRWASGLVPLLQQPRQDQKGEYRGLRLVWSFGQRDFKNTLEEDVGFQHL